MPILAEKMIKRGLLEVKEATPTVVKRAFAHYNRHLKRYGDSSIAPRDFWDAVPKEHRKQAAVFCSWHCDKLSAYAYREGIV